MRKTIKMAVCTAIMLMGLGANAQVTKANKTTATGVTDESIGKQQEAVMGEDGGYVKVIDNKGTKKFLQSKNSITMFTDKKPSGGVVTTWQLGGELTVDTTINFGDTVKFTIDGKQFVLNSVEEEKRPAETVPAGGGAPTINWEVLVRDETTGQIKKVKLTELLKVQGIHAEKDAKTADETANKIDIEVKGLVTATDKFKVWVYRNGAKLISGKDYTFGADKVVINAPTDWHVYEGDYFEVHYVK